MTCYHHNLAMRAFSVADAGFDWNGDMAALLMPVVVEMNNAVQLAKTRTQYTPIDFAGTLTNAGVHTLCVLHRCWKDEWAASRIRDRRPLRGPAHLYHPVEVLVWPVLGMVCCACSHTSERDQMISCELLLLEIYRLADKMDIDLGGLIEDKIMIRSV